MNMDCAFSVILCTWNNCTRLRETLEALTHCRTPAGVPWELVIVNNCCTDDTDHVVTQFDQRLPIRLVHEPTQGLSNARNAGCRAANGALVIFTDDDVEPVPGWLEAYWRSYCAQPTGQFWGGPVSIRFAAAAPSAELLALAPYCIKGLDYDIPGLRPRGRTVFLGANWAVPSAALRVLGGFDPALGLDPTVPRQRTGEETDLMDRLRQAGYEPVYVRTARLTHHVPSHKTTLQHIAARKRAIAAARERSVPVSRMALGLRLARKACRWWWARLLGHPAFGEYVTLQECLGRLDAVRERAQKKRPGAKGGN